MTSPRRRALCRRAALDGRGA